MFRIDPYDESGMTHADFGEVEPPPCADCPLACSSWADLLLCAPWHYSGLVGKYYGTGSAMYEGASTCFLAKEVPF